MRIDRLVAASLVLACAAVACGADGDLDPSFGDGGRVVDYAGGSIAYRVAVDAQHRVFVSGRFGGASGIARYGADGVRDDAFTSAANPFGPMTTPGAIALGRDGLLLVAGIAQGGPTTNDGTIARLRDDGTLDTSFGESGIARILLDGQQEISSLTVLRDGAIIASTVEVDPSTGLGKAAVARLTSDGVLDPAFGVSGLCEFDACTPAYGEPGSSAAGPLAETADGCLVVSVWVQRSSDGSGMYVAARIRADGSFDETFGNGGVSPIPQIWPLNSVTALADGSSIFAGDGAVVKLAANGSPATGFGTGGVVPIPRLLTPRAWPAANGDIVLVGTGAGTDIAMKRLLPDGSVDPTFAPDDVLDGIRRFEFPDDQFAYDSAVDGDAFVVVGQDGDYPSSAALIERHGYPFSAEAPSLVLTLPAAMTVEATGPGGAYASFAVTATDDVDPAPTIVTSPASGDLFAVGDTTVVATATDAAGNVATGSFVVHVVDTTPPALALPASMTVSTSSTDGAVVAFSVTATDLVDGPVATQATPASGSCFPVGDTTVAVTATDAHGNTATGSFVVHVVDPVMAAWTSADIGKVGLAGRTTIGATSLIVSGAGGDIWNTSDECRFVSQPLNGDGTITARVASLADASSSSKVGLMIRGSLDASAANASIALTNADALSFQRRADDHGGTTATSGGAATVPRWLRLSRSGTTFTASSSIDGATWATVGSATIPMGASAYVGFAVTSRRTSALCTATFDHITLVAGASASQPQASAPASDGPIEPPHALGWLERSPPERAWTP